MNGIVGGKPKVTGLRVFKTAAGYIITHQAVLLCEVGAVNFDIEAIKTVETIYGSDPDKTFALFGNKGTGALGKAFSLIQMMKSGFFRQQHFSFYAGKHWKPSKVPKK